MRRVVVVIWALAVAVVGLVSVSPHAAVALPATSRFVALPPTRVLDTRTGPGTIGLVAAGGTVAADLSLGGVPAGATAAALNLTITASTAPGYVTAYAAGSPRPGTSSVNVSVAGETVSNFVIVPLGATPTVTLYDLGGSHLVVDVSGYWLATTDATAGRFVPSAPHRILDTRDASPYLPAGTTVDVDVVTLAGLPADASAVAATVTGVNAQGPGFVTVWPAGQGRPNSSIVNLPAAGATVPNLVIVPIGAGGKVSLFTANGAHLLLDVVGYMTGVGAPSSSDGLFVPVVPSRVADSRPGGSMDRLAAGLYDEVHIAGAATVPATGVGAVVANLTVTDPFGPGYLTAFPGATGRPTASTLNYSRGQSAAGLSLVQVGANGTIGLYSLTGADIIVDVAGWFTGARAVDGGVKPRLCRNLMGFQHVVTTADFDDIVIRDMSGATPDVTVAGNSVGVRFAANCEYMIVAQPNPTVADTFDLYRYDSVNGGASKKIVTAMSWHGLGLSRDSRYLYFYQTTVHGAAGTGSDLIAAYDAVTGTTSLAFRTALPEVVDNIGGVFRDGRIAFDAFVTANGADQLYTAVPGAAPTLMYGAASPGDYVAETLSPDELTLGVIRVNPAVGVTSSTPDVGFAGTPPTTPAFSLGDVYPLAVHSRFTWSGDRVADLGPGSVAPQPRPAIVRQQGGTTGSFVTLLNGDTDYEPEFAYSYAPSAVPNLTPLPK